MAGIVWRQEIRYLLVALLAMALLPVWAQSAAERYPDAVWMPVSRAVGDILQNRKIKGVSIAVVDDQTLVWAKGFGTADVFNRRKATADTIYRVGNLAKLFTATAVMQLQDQGKLDIDQPLQRYLPAFDIQSRFSTADPITVRSVLCHHAGLPCDWLLDTWSTRPTPVTDYARLLRDEYTIMPTNMMYAYSNLGYGLLAHMVQQVSGRDYASYLESALFKPLGMHTTSFTRAVDLRPQDAKLYVGGYEQDVLPLGDTPGDAVYSSVKDLGKFMSMVLAGGNAGNATLLGSAALNDMVRIQNKRSAYDFDVNTGLGWFREGAMVSIPGYDGYLYGNGGATMTNNYAAMVILPREKLGIVILANSTEIGPELANLVTTTAKAALQARTGKEWASIRTPDFPPEVTLERPQRQALTGTFATDYFALIEINERAGKLAADIGKFTLALKTRKGGVLTVVPPRVLWFFTVPIGPFADMQFSITTVNSHRLLLQKVDGFTQCVGESLEPTPIPAAWKARTGTYVVTNSTADSIAKMSFTLALDHDFLVVRANNAALPISVALDPVNDREAVTMGLGRFKGETVRVKNINGQEILEYSGFRLKRKP